MNETLGQHNTKQISDKTEHPMDLRLAKLRDETLPSTPYIFSGQGCMNEDYVRSNYPRNSKNFQKHSLFSRGEAELQYLTFLKDRPGGDEIGCYFAKGGWDDGKGRMAGLEQHHSRTSSNATPGQGQAPRKKITLEEYKNRDRNKASATTVKPSPPELNGVTKSEEKASSHTLSAKDVIKPQQTEQHGQKRSADTMTSTKDPQNLLHPPSSPPAKKPRVAAEISTAMTETHLKSTVDEPPKQTTPAQLEIAGIKEASPKTEAIKNTIPTAPHDIMKGTCNNSMPAKLIPASLPPMVSPLSLAVEETILRLNSTIENGKLESARSKSALKSPFKVKSKPDHSSTPTARKAVKVNAVEKPTSSAKPLKATASTKGPQEQGQKKSVPAAQESGPKIATPNGKQNRQPVSDKSASVPTPKITPPDAPKKLRFRIKLKIKKKANRKSLMTYLNLKPTPGRNSLFPGRHGGTEELPAELVLDSKETEHARNSQAQKPSVSKPSRAENPKTGTKRARAHTEEDEAEPSAKRKAPGWLPQTQKPSTPRSLQTTSPAMSHLGSAHKPPTSTPGTQTSGTAMLRGGSAQDSVHTPQQPSVTGTPTVPETGRRRRSYTSPDKPKSEELMPEAELYRSKAVQLKRAADVYLRKADAVSEEDRKLGLVLGAEAVLCFIMAFALGDTSKNYSDRTAWNSLLPLLSVVQRAAEGPNNFKHIQGLLSQLEAIIRDQIAYADMQILDRNPLKHEFGNTVTDASKSKEQHKAGEYHKRYSEMHTHFMKAQSAWRTGWLLLDIADIPKHYPDTWAKRDVHRAAYGKGRDAVKKDEYARKYLLPMNNMTSGLEAVSFGLNFLTEWSKKQNIGWTPKLQF